jgi:sulfate transport system permease protein
LRIDRKAQWSLRTLALLYLLILLVLPVVVVFFKTFEHGFAVAWAWVTTPAAGTPPWF